MRPSLVSNSWSQNDPPALAFQSAAITDMSHHAQPFVNFLSSISLCFVTNVFLFIIFILFLETESWSMPQDGMQ